MGWNNGGEAPTCLQLLRDYRQRSEAVSGVKLPLDPGQAGFDVYNVSSPFEDEGETVIAGRVELRRDELSEVFIFVQRGGVWMRRPDAPRFAMQDPFVAHIQDELVFGGVEVETLAPSSKTIVNWRTVFYRGRSLRTLERFAEGPWGMKDIRLVEMADGRVGLLTRPIDTSRLTASIGFRTLDRLQDLNVESIGGARLFRGQFRAREWGGAGEAHVLPNGVVAAVGHLAYRGRRGELHYYAATFACDPITHLTTPWKIVATRDDLPPGPAKRWDLVDVVFPGGLVRQADGRALLYGGVSDTESYRVAIPDPFLEYEQLPAAG